MVRAAPSSDPAKYFIWNKGSSMNFLKKFFGSKNDREIKRLSQYVTQVNALEAGMKSLSDEQLREKTTEFKQRYANGETLEKLLPEAFAVVREAGWRVDRKRHFDVQIIGGAVLHEGRIAEMRTGEGKTLTATLPIYLNALAGKGAHVVTVNDYLARRDAEWMGKIYSFLGMTTGCILHGLTDKQRREAYRCDITYGTNNEFGFDYLRDNMKTEIDRLVQREYFFAIVDEVDSILIDEARTPLIISGPSETNTELYVKVNAAIPGLQKDSDYIVDEKSRTVALTEDGISKLEKRLRVENLYDPNNIEYLHHVQQALKSHILFKKDVDYVVEEGKVVIVDEHTGRKMPGRRFSDGLHGALEAKEHVRVQNETQTLATITFQNFFRMYDKLAGMTGTADTESVEFQKIYKLDVVVIPTNRSLIRKDDEDVIFRTAKEKFTVIADEIAEAQKRGQPVLVGTVSVEKSELLASLLRKRGIPHEVLNAKNHGREAEIIALAGQPGQVTISTNMAGRGTDIVLGPGVVEKGGLYVIGTERHESRRIDNQLRGRSGRQGDPGLTRFYLSLEDDLMRIFASDRLSSIMGRLGMQEGEAIISPMVTRAIARAQKRVEEQNFSSRKHLLEYDDVMNQQRQVIYGLRRNALEGKKKVDQFKETVAAIVAGALAEIAPEVTGGGAWDMDKVHQILKAVLHESIDLSSMHADEMTIEGVGQLAAEQVAATYEKKMTRIGEENRTKIESWVYLQVIDKAWKNHLMEMDNLKDSVSLRGYGQRDPLQEYKKEAFRLFETMMFRIEEEASTALIHLEIPDAPQGEIALTASRAEPDEKQLTYRHPEAEAATAPASPQPAATKNTLNNGRAEEKDGMIYHGSRSRPAARPVVQPVRRDIEKVGRNDPCPCGSGKKYKKCHGAAAGDDANL
jgi:preprotein translocase subunit SecA